MDNYSAIRTLNFPSLAASLGIAISGFKRSAEEFVGPCPIHGSKNNRGCFRYNDDGKFHCFSCGAKGRGGIDLTMQLLKIGFKAAVERLCDVQSLPAKEKAPEAISDTSGAESMQTEVKPMQKDTWRKFAVASPWLEQRIPDAGVRELYGVFAYDNPSRRSAYSGRVMLPVKDSKGVLYGYLGRSIGDGAPKYLFPKNLPKSRFLFGAHELTTGQWGSLPLRRIYLVESPFCVMKFASLGLPALSPFGWSVSEQQLGILSSLARGLIYLPDRNKHEQAVHTVGQLAHILWIRSPMLPAGIDDPEQMTKEQILAL